MLVKAGQRVLLEKPLTGTLAGDKEFCDQLDREYPSAVMLAFQLRHERRYYNPPGTANSAEFPATLNLDSPHSTRESPRRETLRTA